MKGKHLVQMTRGEQRDAGILKIIRVEVQNYNAY